MAPSPWQSRDVTLDYETGRAEYPAGLIPILVDDVGLTAQDVVVDLAAGTGKLTRVLAPLVRRVVAVDLAERMLSALRRSVPGAAVVAGAAEAIPLRDACADAVTAGNALHWFRPVQALDEMTRVARPGGAVVALWNFPRFELQQDPHVHELLDAVATVRPLRSPGSADFQPEVWMEGFTSAAHRESFRHRWIRYDHRWTRLGLRAYVGSWSTAAAMSDEARADLLRTVEEILEAAPQPIVVPHQCHVFWTSAKAS